jgi:hypothetical protein
MKRRKTIRLLGAGAASCVFSFTIPKFQGAGETVNLIEVRNIISEHFESLQDREAGMALIVR